MNADPTTAAANMAAAEGQIQQTLGLDGTDESNWTQAQMVSYLQNLSAYIVANPNQFTAGQVTSAQNVTATNWSNLEAIPNDLSDQLDDLQTQLVNNASSVGSSISSFGQGIANVIQNAGTALSNLSSAASNASSVAQWALPAAVVVGLILFANTKKASVGKGGVSYSN